MLQDPNESSPLKEKKLGLWNILLLNFEYNKEAENALRQLPRFVE